MKEQIVMIPQLSPLETQTADYLLRQEFSPEQVKKIIEHFRYKSKGDFDPEVVKASVSFWIK